MATIYVSPSGSGTGSGSSASNAMAFASLNDAIKAAGPGGTVLLLADKGAYNVSGTITIDSGGTDAAPVTLKGVSSTGVPMDIQIYGTRPAFSPGMADEGNVLLKLMDGANNLVFEGFDFHNVQMAFRLGGDIHNVTIQNMEADNVGYFVGNFASGTNTSPSVTDLTISDVVIHGFSKAAIFLQYDTNGVVIDNVYADSEYDDDGAVITMGIHLDGTVHDVLVQNSTILNCISAGAQTDYWNGDGFCTESGVYSVRFVNCVASGNGDAGFDIKSGGTVLENCTSEDNARNFRIWSDVQLINPIGIDPHVRGGTASQLQIQAIAGGHVTVTGGNFVDSGSGTAVAVTEGTGSSIVFSGTSFTHVWDSRLAFGSNITGINSNLVHEVVATGAYSTNGAYYLDNIAWMTGTIGADTLTAPLSGNWTLNGLAGNDVITGSGGKDLITGGTGDDTIRGGAGDDVVRLGGAGQGFDTIDGGTGYDKLVITQNNTVIGLKSITGIEEITANGYGAAWINGTSGDDFLDFTNVKLTSIVGIKTFAGNDTIYGSAGNDFIVPGQGVDTMRGNAGADLFKFSACSETKVAAPDKILDFQPGVDKIDLANIDANGTLTGNQAFKFIGSAAFTKHAGELRLDYSDPSFTKILGDSNGDGIADFAIQLSGKPTLTSGDFIL